MSVGNTKALENYIAFCSAKNKVISKNIANIETKDYKREDVAFKDLLQANVNSALKATNEKHFGANSANNSSTEFDTIQDKSKDMVSGINNVDIDTEMAELADNSVKFKFAAKKLGGYYRDLQGVIRGAR
jgi:flagellar basal-body rod protein FlgB